MIFHQDNDVSPLSGWQKSLQLCIFLVKVTQLCQTLCDTMDYTVHGILQARILEWVAFPFSRVLPNPGIEPRSPALQADSLPAEPPRSPRILEWIAYPFSSGSSLPKNRTGVSCLAGRFFTSWATREAPSMHLNKNQILPLLCEGTDIYFLMCHLWVTTWGCTWNIR